MFSWQWFKAASVTVLIFLDLIINANGKHHFVYKQTQTYPNNQKRNKFPTYLPVFCWPFPQHGEYVIRESVIS